MEALTLPDRPMFTGRALRQLIVPLMIEQLLAMTVGMADTVMLTSVSEAAVSGVALVDVINNLIIQVLAALSTGGAVVCSQYIGRKEPENARMAARQLVYVAVAFALVVSAPLLLFRHSLLGLIFGKIDPAVLSNAQTYLLLTGLSFPFLAVYNACAALFRSMGNSRVSLFASLIMNVVNIGGNAVLIYGCGWGAAGAGTATLVSRAIAAVMMLCLIRNRSMPIWLEHLLCVRLNRGMIQSILRVGIPTGTENGLFQVGKLIVQTLIASLGTAAIAANAIVNSIGSLMIVPGSAMGLAMITVVGQCVGAGDYRQATAYTKKLMIFAYLTISPLNLALLATLEPVLSLFHLSAEASGIAAEVLSTLCILHATLWPMAFTFPNALRAAGDARYTMLCSIISMWVLRVGLSYVFVLIFHLGVPGVWYSMYCDWLLRIILFALRYRSGKWKTKRVIN